MAHEGLAGSTPVTNAILAYLAAQRAETVTTAAVTEHLQSLGQDHGKEPGGALDPRPAVIRHGPTEPRHG